jgi:hypothetical protein
MLDLSVVVPVRNAEAFVDGCLEAILRSNPREVIVVDRLSSTSGLAEIAGVADAGALPSSDGEIVCTPVSESGRAS